MNNVDYTLSLVLEHVCEQFNSWQQQAFAMIFLSLICTELVVHDDHHHHHLLRRKPVITGAVREYASRLMNTKIQI